MFTYFSVDSIDLTVLDIFDTAITEIEDVYDTAPITARNVGRFVRRATPDNIVDVHGASPVSDSLSSALLMAS